MPGKKNQRGGKGKRDGGNRKPKASPPALAPNRVSGQFEGSWHAPIPMDEGEIAKKVQEIYQGFLEEIKEEISPSKSDSDPPTTFDENKKYAPGHPYLGGPGKYRGPGGRELCLRMLDRMLAHHGNLGRLLARFQELFDADPAKFWLKFVVPLLPKNLKIEVPLQSSPLRILAGMSIGEEQEESRSQGIIDVPTRDGEMDKGLKE